MASEFEMLKKNLRILKDAPTTDFRTIKRCMLSLKSVPALNHLKEEFDVVLNAIEEALNPRSFLEKLGISKGHIKRAVEAMEREGKRIMDEAEKYAEKVRPKEIYEKGREQIIDIIREFRRYDEKLTEDLREYGTGEGETLPVSTAERLWAQYYQNYISKFLRILQQLKDKVPYLEYENSFVYTLRRIDDVESEDFAPFKIEEFIKFRNQMNGLVAKVKALYNIREDEIEKRPFILMPVGEVKKIPKYRNEIEELERLSKELASQIGLNRPTIDVKRTLMEMVSRVERIVLSDLSESSVSDEDRNFLKNSYLLKEKIEGMSGDELLSELDKKMLRESIRP